MNVLGLGFRASATLDSFKTGVSEINFLDKIDLIAVPHDEFKLMGGKKIRSLGKSSSVIYDLKYILLEDQSDLRL